MASHPPPPTPRRARSPAGALLGLALLAAAAAANNLAPVELAMAGRVGLVEELSLTGTLTSPHSARLAPAVEGRIAEIAVDAGSRVAGGDMLVRLDDELARLELRQATAAEREAAAELADAERRLEEARKLVKRQSFAETEVRSREAEVERDGAVLARSRAQRAYNAALVDRHTLTAPFDGVVASRGADLGEWVNTDSAVLELVAVDRLQLDLQVPQTYFRRVREGTPVEVRLDALPGEPFEARIARIVPVSDPSTRTFLVRALLDNAGARLTPGMSARALLRMGTGREGVVVPRDALIRYPDGRTIVWVANGDGEQRRVEERRVRTGLVTSTGVEIVDGLDAGAAVVVRGNESLRQDQEVRVRAVR